MRITIKASIAIFLLTIGSHSANALDTQQTGRKKVSKDGKQYVESREKKNEDFFENNYAYDTIWQYAVVI